MKPDYVFVVGSFRSGTTLVRRILDSSEEISICPETQFLGYFISSGYRERIAEAGTVRMPRSPEDEFDKGASETNLLLSTVRETSTPKLGGFVPGNVG